MSVVNQEVGAEGPGSEVIHAAGSIRHVPHDDDIGLREPVGQIRQQRDRESPDG